MEGWKDLHGAASSEVLSWGWLVAPGLSIFILL